MNTDVDFVVGAPDDKRSGSPDGWDGSGDDEYGTSAHYDDLDEFGPDGSRPWRLPGTPPVRRAVAVVITLAAAVTVLLTNRSTPPARTVAAHLSPAPGAAVMGPIGVARPEPTTAQLVRLLLGVPPCPWADGGQSFCATDFSLPPDAVAALRLYFPGVRDITDVTHVVRDFGAGGAPNPGTTHGLWTRTISGRVGPMQLTVTVRTNEATPLGGGMTSIDGQRYTYCEQRLGNFLLAVVLVSDRSGKGVFSDRVAFDRVFALAGDERLLHV